MINYSVITPSSRAGNDHITYNWILQHTSDDPTPEEILTR